MPYGKKGSGKNKKKGFGLGQEIGEGRIWGGGGTGLRVNKEKKQRKRLGGKERGAAGVTGRETAKDQRGGGATNWGRFSWAGCWPWDTEGGWVTEAVHTPRQMDKYPGVSRSWAERGWKGKGELRDVAAMRWVGGGQIMGVKALTAPSHSTKKTLEPGIHGGGRVIREGLVPPVRPEKTLPSEP